MNTIVIIGIVAAIIVGAVVYMNYNSSSTTLDSSNLDTSSQNAQTSSSSFVNDTTPTSDQQVPNVG